MGLTLARAPLDAAGHPYDERARVDPNPQLTGFADEVAVELGGLRDVGR
jgi:hypothetical protein